MVEDENPSESEIDDLIAKTTWFSGPALVWGSIDSLVDGGQLLLVDDTALRERLTRVHEYKGRYEGLVDAEEEHLNLVIVPFLTENALLPQINNSGSQFPGGGSDYRITHFPLSYRLNHSELLSNSAFLGILNWKLGHMTDGEFVNRRYREASKQLIESLEARLSESTN